MGCFPSKDELPETSPPTNPPSTPSSRPSQTATTTTTAPSSKPAGSNSNPLVSATGGPTPLYKYLPSNAEKFSVRNVYDGDTLTLVDERKVRLLGIDTPELKEKQPYADEAKNYTNLRCYQRSVWLVIDGEDHYGRILAHVYVPSEDEKGYYLCINEGLVDSGYAYAYIPQKDKQPFNWSKMVKLQTQARKAKRGIWSRKIDYNQVVYVTLNGAAYHEKSDCTHLSKSKNLKEMKLSAALDLGLHPCRTCSTTTSTS